MDAVYQGTSILLCGGGWKLFSPLRGTNYKTRHLQSLFGFNTLRGTARTTAAAAVDILRLDALNR